MKLIRVVNSTDHQAINNLVDNYPVTKVAKSYTKHSNLTKVKAVLRDEDPNLTSMIIAETYLMLFHVSSPWFSNKSFFEELLVVKLYPNLGTMEHVFEAVNFICESLGLSGAMVGTALATNDAAMARIYERNGFEKTFIGLYKDINNENT